MPIRDQTAHLKVAISGSFHRHLSLIKDAIFQFQENGCEVLSPRDVKVVAEIADFLFVESDLYRSVSMVENRHLFSIAASDLLWLVAPDGYIGQSASLEVGYAIAKGKPIYCERNPPDLTIAEYVSVIATPRQAIEDYRRSGATRHISFSNLLLNPVGATKEAHDLIDTIAYLLIKPGIMKPTEIEKEISIVIGRLKEIFSISLKRGT